ncbi:MULTISPECIES: phage baseplate plug family protein [Burkholderia]|uniref:phage baseplate plug family protein n=1 Tax=Burkholderia TaxID=32008 RepID=UPI000EF298C9|nr:MULTISPECIES: hypothetical protein [Burkholderia]ALJ98698.1 hypothetical protein PE067_019 [Burkholderia phage PE067]AYJ74286.1 hypothetical protein phiE131_020 [Burkholderia phage phiE131]AYJ74356.1 hypothetical protein phiE058_020 [Burkholderia phage phiE058]MCE4125370.1 hypothetical protein [Burkholderia cepacia]MCS6499049.1 hypothetical protein [Burkholderia thailandensis]
MLTLPITARPAQNFSVLLAGQNCQISVYQKTTGLYLDLAVNNATIKGGIICRDRVRLIRYAYLGFIGDLTFFDTQGVDDPQYAGLGTRWQLVYLEAGDLA